MAVILIGGKLANLYIKINRSKPALSGLFLLTALSFCIILNLYNVSQNGGENMEKQRRIVIIGGVAGGMSAATRLRRLDESLEIIVIERGPYVSFANCGLPYYLSGVIAKRSRLLVQTPERLKQRFNLEVRTETEVCAIEPQAQYIQVSSCNGIEEIHYDELIVSTGAYATKPSIPGLDKAKNAFTVRNVPDIDQIKVRVDANEVQRAVVLGPGYIGIEMAENLRELGIEVSLIGRSAQVLHQLDYEMARYVEDELVANGVHLYLSTQVIEFLEEGRYLRLNDGTVLASDLTIIATGVLPESNLLAAAGAQLGEKGCVLVDENYQTSLPHVYAIGDVISVWNEVSHTQSFIPLASPANRQGRQVADVLAWQRPQANKGGIGTSIVKVFSLGAASTGLNEKEAQKNHLPYACIHLYPADHATYYPQAESFVLKLVFHKETGEILGAQAIGKKTIARRIDVLAVAIKAKMTVAELQELELCYAPPFGTAKDPINMLGYVGENRLRHCSEVVQWYELDEKLKEKNTVLLDVRTEKERTKLGTFPQEHLFIPVDELRERVSELDQSKTYIIACQVGLRSYIAERFLRQKGFNVFTLDGGYQLYAKAKKLKF